MSQTIWYFDAPTLRYCVVHKATDFHYDAGSGLRCGSHGGGECDEKCWLDFALDTSDYPDLAVAEDFDGGVDAYAEDYGTRLNTRQDCNSCLTQHRLTELVDGLHCEDCAEDIAQQHGQDEEE